MTKSNRKTKAIYLKDTTEQDGRSGHTKTFGYLNCLEKIFLKSIDIYIYIYIYNGKGKLYI